MRLFKTNPRINISFSAVLGLSIAAPVWHCGCQGKAPDSAGVITHAPPIRDPGSLIKFLPAGASFKSPIVSDRILGDRTRTLEEALGRLQVTARDGSLFDGIGREIRFLNLKEVRERDKDYEKTLQRLRSKYCVVVIDE